MPKVMVIGLDGATFKLLGPWMDEGKLPHLREIRDQGVSGTLKSSIPPATAPAWQCFMSGKNPGKHGVHFFQVRKPGSYDQVPVFATSFRERTLWEILSEAGYRVLVLNVPFTFPPKRVNGVLISGFTTPPSRRQECCYPPELLAEIEAKFGEYPLQLKTPPFLMLHQGGGASRRCYAIAGR
jgi:predicted AlkP superfamily phosphohydrolase/phosphomutase